MFTLSIVIYLHILLAILIYYYTSNDKAICMYTQMYYKIERFEFWTKYFTWNEICWFRFQIKISFSGGKHLYIFAYKYDYVSMSSLVPLQDCTQRSNFHSIGNWISAFTSPKVKSTVYFSWKYKKENKCTYFVMWKSILNIYIWNCRYIHHRHRYWRC